MKPQTSKRLKYAKPFYCPYPSKKCKNCHYGQQQRCSWLKTDHTGKEIILGNQTTLFKEDHAN